MGGGEYLSIKRGRQKCSGIRVSMNSYLSASNDIFSESGRYAEKNLGAWYAMHATGAGTKRFGLPTVRYLGSGSYEKALSICISKTFWNLVAQYTVGTFLKC